MNLPQLKIGNLTFEIPIVQGGMGVGISLSKLAGTVSLNGGLGVISGVEIGFLEKDYYKDKLKANLEAMRKHIEKAKEISKGKPIGINIMVAVNDFEEYVKEAVKSKIDIIFSGAGLPMNLPKLIEGTQTKIAPIVSSARSASLIMRNWDKKYNKIPDAIVVEGPLAGGHLGYSKEMLKDENVTLENILAEVLEAIIPFVQKYGKEIPVIAGGGIYNGSQIAELIKKGASGVQIGSRFVATNECDASEEFKQAYVNSSKEDIIIIDSPVGMPGRAIRNEFLNQVELGNKKPTNCTVNCLVPCEPQHAPYCIANALINAQRGYFNSGYAFIGANGYRIDKITSVKEVFDELVNEAIKN
jgi:NAD(P)H-dependent flavin oxidoreductase YrpB (nitropropane dioxygenase family)